MAVINSTKAVIVYLSRSQARDISDLKRSLSLLDENFNNRFKYPVLIFHEDFDDELMEDIRKSTYSNLRFEKIRFEIPTFLNIKEIPKAVYVNDTPFSLGYRHMCRFMSVPIFQHPAVKNYDYLWRLDTDSFLLDKIDYDVFELMKSNDYIYGYLTIWKDEKDAVKGLWDATKQFLKENNIKPTFLNKFISNETWDMSYYYTNFEISKIDFWLSDGPLNYFNYLDRIGGTYKYRWGDHVIHLLMLSIFAQEDQIHKFSDIAYQHQDFINNHTGIKNSAGYNPFSLKLKKVIASILKVFKILMNKSKLLRRLSKLLWRLLVAILPIKWLRLVSNIK